MKRSFVKLLSHCRDRKCLDKQCTNRQGLEVDLIIDVEHIGYIIWYVSHGIASRKVTRRVQELLRAARPGQSG